MTTEHLRPLLDTHLDMQLLHAVCQQLARAEVSQSVIHAIRNCGDIFRRLTARTMAQQLSKVVEAATSPFQCAFSTRAGCECVAHTFQALCEINLETTVVSVDGISAYDAFSPRQCHLFTCSTVLRPNICGRTRRVWCTPLTRAKGENKGIR